MQNQIKEKSLNSKRTILAIFAHPDDESFLVGGTLAHYAAQGVPVKLLCLTHGEKGFPSDASVLERRQLAEIRGRELKRCCEVLGIELLPILNFPDGRLAEFGLSSLAKPIAQAIWQLKPEITLTFGADGLTGHPDHIILHRAVTLAFEIAAPTGAALFYAGLSEKSVGQLSTRLSGSLGSLPLGLVGVPKIDADTAINIRHTSRQKWAALDCHQSQAHNFVSLTKSDRSLLGQWEYFQLAQVTGAYVTPAISSKQSTPFATDLFSRVSLCAKLRQIA